MATQIADYMLCAARAMNLCCAIYIRAAVRTDNSDTDSGVYAKRAKLFRFKLIIIYDCGVISYESSMFFEDSCRIEFPTSRQLVRKCMALIDVVDHFPHLFIRLCLLNFL